MNNYLDKTFEPQAIEKKWFATWSEHNYHSGQYYPERPSFSIVIPPPNVTGSLHMGHAFQDTLMDILIRYKRMDGCNTLWQLGTDHAGIATQMVVERNLALKNIDKYQLGRDEFIKEIWRFKEQSGSRIIEQIKTLGASLDYSDPRFSMDQELSHAVQKAFVQLYDEGLIYRNKHLVNWDPKLKTAISDLEVENREKQGSLWHIKYPLRDKSGFISIATTRPETMLGDTAIAVNPKDARYQHLIGKEVIVPLCERVIRIIADESVDLEFGSGCVKITPAHDFNDYEMGMRHKLPQINILNDDATLNENVPANYRGLDRFAARSKIIEELTALELLEKTEDHTLNIPYGDRSNTVVEPMLKDQWFVKTAPLAEPAVEAVKSGKINFVPENWQNTFFAWMNNLQDWCISRQLWWGHRAPAWYDDNGNFYVAHSLAEVYSKYNLSQDVTLHQDEDVLDTWFSAALWPFASLGWPQDSFKFEHFYPTSVLITGFDIIFFWVARMMMFALKFTGEIPFHTVYIHGLIRDHDGQKMSKSKGNVIDPLDVIYGISQEELIKKQTANLMQPKLADKIKKNISKNFPDGIPAVGTDALRFYFCAMASTGRDLRFDLQRIFGYRNFCNKLWNASRFVFMNTEDFKEQQALDFNNLANCDKWILSKLQLLIKDARSLLDNYRFDLFAQNLYEFVWHAYCDWYLEFAKATLNDANTSIITKQTTQHTLLFVLDQILRLLHPVIPFISEEIWQHLRIKLPVSCNTAHLINAQFPQYNATLYDVQHVREIDFLSKVIAAIRNIRSESNIAPKKEIPVYLTGATQLQSRLTLIEGLTNAKVHLEKLDSLASVATAVIDPVEIFIPLKGLIDFSQERQRINKQLNKLQKQLDKLQQKTSNPSYMERAPAELIAADTRLQEELILSINKLKQNLQSLKD